MGATVVCTGRPGREPGQTFDEEDLYPDSQTVTPADEPADDDVDEESLDFSEKEQEEPPQQDLPQVLSGRSRENLPLPSAESDASLGEGNVEESPVVTNGPPALPAASSLLPREQVALSFIIAGVAAMDKEDIIRAQTHFERAIEVAPLLPYSYYFLGRLALTRGEHQKALPLLRKAHILLTRGDQAWRSEAMSAQGAVYEDLGEVPQARRAYRESLQLSPRNLRAISALARLAGEEPDSDGPVSQ